MPVETSPYTWAMGSFIIALCALVVLALFGLALWAKRNPANDPEDAEWMNDIK